MILITLNYCIKEAPHIKPIVFLYGCGTSNVFGRTRTCDFQRVKLTLYPTELRRQFIVRGGKTGSNRRPIDLETITLPLSYYPFTILLGE